MSIVIRPPTDDEWPAVCRADGRAFGNQYTDQEIEDRRPLHDLSRFRIAFDGTAVVGVAGSYALDATVPGGTTIPMGGVTWVSTAATHRRQGLMRRVVTAVHDDIAERGEPLATLSASEGGIYENVGYGIASQVRVTSLDPRATRLREAYRVADPRVRSVEGDDVIPIITEIWDRFRRCRTGEVSRSDAFHDAIFAIRDKVESGTNSQYLVHPDGFAVYRVEDHWNDGHPAHTLELSELVAVTPDAHAALWQVLLGVDLIAKITSRAIAIDDPLPYLLENQRALRTTDLNDGIWTNVLEPSICFGARTYRTADRLVVEVDGTRWAIDGGPDGASCRRVRTRPDLVATHPAFSSLLYGGVSPSQLVAGRRMTARSADVLARADLFFTTSQAPHCQTHY